MYIFVVFTFVQFDNTTLKFYGTHIVDWQLSMEYAIQIKLISNSLSKITALLEIDKIDFIPFLTLGIDTDELDAETGNLEEEVVEFLVKEEVIVLEEE